jgi:CheY-like chemotaxis protein
MNRQASKDDVGLLHWAVAPVTMMSITRPTERRARVSAGIQPASLRRGGAGRGGCRRWLPPRPPRAARVHHERVRVVIRVLLAEDQAMVRGALAALLRLEEDIAVVGEVERADRIVSVARETRPDVALLDIETPGGDGLSAAAELRRALPECRVVMLTTFGRVGYLKRAMTGGAVGFLLKDEPAAELA